MENAANLKAAETGVGEGYRQQVSQGLTMYIHGAQTLPQAGPNRTWDWGH